MYIFERPVTHFVIDKQWPILVVAVAYKGVSYNEPLHLFISDSFLSNRTQRSSNFGGTSIIRSEMSPNQKKSDRT